MKSKDAVMQEIFNNLTERNKDIMILVAKSVDIAQKDSEQRNNSTCNKTDSEYEYMNI